MRIHIHPIFSTHTAELAFAFTSIYMNQNSVHPNSRTSKNQQKKNRNTVSIEPITVHHKSRFPRPKRTPTLRSQPQNQSFPKQHNQTMCGLMPCDSGYDLNLYPNLARYRTPQRDINDNTHKTTCNSAENDTYNNTYYNATHSNTHHYIPYSDSLTIPPYQPKPKPQEDQKEDDEEEEEEEEEEQEEEEEEEQFPSRTPRYYPITPNIPSTLPIAKDPALPTIFIRLFASDILMWGDEWRRCPACLGGTMCLLRGKCVEDGRRVKVLFW
jgi:hypothetical protein